MGTKPGKQIIKQGLFKSKWFKLFNQYKQEAEDTFPAFAQRFAWNLFDQILFTTNFFEIKSGTHYFSEASIFDEAFLKQYKGKYKGNPFRTYVGKRYTGAYSDHFPVYLHLKLKIWF